MTITSTQLREKADLLADECQRIKHEIVAADLNQWDRAAAERVRLKRHLHAIALLRGAALALDDIAIASTNL